MIFWQCCRVIGYDCTERVFLLTLECAVGLSVRGALEIPRVTVTVVVTRYGRVTWWAGGVMGRASQLRSRWRRCAESLDKQVSGTSIPLSPSSIIWYQRKLECRQPHHATHWPSIRVLAVSRCGTENWRTSPPVRHPEALPLAILLLFTISSYLIIMKRVKMQYFFNILFSVFLDRPVWILYLNIS